MALVKYPLRITLSSYAPVLSEYKNLPFLSQRAPTWKHLLPFRSFFIAELSNGVGMGNQLSTWNLSIQSAVDGENFNYNPDYNQVPFFYQVTLISICFLSIPACSLQPNGAVLTQASMARLHFLLSPREKKRPREKKTFSSGSLHIRRLHLVLHRDRSNRRQSRLFGLSKSFCAF